MTAGAHELAVEAPPAAECETEMEAPELVIALPSGDREDRFDVLVPTRGQVELRIANTADEDADVTLFWELWCERETRAPHSMPLGRVSTDSSKALAVSADVLALPAGTFERSGNVTLWAEGRLAGGSDANAARTSLAFHPIDGGWRLYDLATRDASYSGGALTARAREAQTRVASRLRPGVRLAGHGTGVPDDVPEGWKPSLDAPPDDEEGGAR